MKNKSEKNWLEQRAKRGPMDDDDVMRFFEEKKIKKNNIKGGTNSQYG